MKYSNGERKIETAEKTYSFLSKPYGFAPVTREQSEKTDKSTSKKQAEKKDEVEKACI